MSTPADLIELGRIIGAHGVHGWIKVQPFSPDSEVLARSKKWWLAAPITPLERSRDVPRPSNVDAVGVVWARPHGATWLARLKGLEDRGGAEALKGRTVLVSRSEFPPTDEGEYYWVDLIGCDVLTDDPVPESRLGVVQSMQDNPAHPILVVRQQCIGGDGTLQDVLDDKGRPVLSLIPFVAAHVLAVDIGARTIHTNWPRDF